MKIKVYPPQFKPDKGRITWFGIWFTIRSFIYVNILFPLGYLCVLIHALFCRKRKYKYEVSLCLIFKDEAPYLKEWIEYHLLIGVDHFYLYNNFSSDHYKEVLSPYIDKGIVTLIDWPYKYAQEACYADCYKKTRDETHWLGITDADEFVNLLQDNNIKLFLKHYRAYPCVYLHWLIFGTSGHIHEPNDALQIEAYTACWPCLSHRGKSFTNNDYRHLEIYNHNSIARFGKFPIYYVDDRYRFKPYYLNPLTSFLPYTPKAVINHYYTRSYDFYQFKMFERGDAQNKQCEENRKHPRRLEWFEGGCSEHDYSIQRWLTLLKLRMGRE